MQRKLISALIAMMVAAMAPSVFAQAEKADKAPAKTEKAPAKAAASKVSVNGVIIPQTYIDTMNKEREAANQPSSPEIQNAIKDELINREILNQAAKKKGIDKDPAVSAQMEMARQAVLIRAYFEDYVKANPVTETQLKSNYAAYVAQLGEKEYKARHILVETEDEAKSIIASLKRGDDFNKLAKDKSKDTGSKENGGDLDWGPAARYVPEFGNALKTLQKGQTTDAAVKTQFGYHIIRLDDSRALKVPTFDEMKDKFLQAAQQDQVAKLVQSLREKAKIEEK